jgi:hypothetical protein
MLFYILNSDDRGCPYIITIPGFISGGCAMVDLSKIRIMKRLKKENPGLLAVSKSESEKWTPLRRSRYEASKKKRAVLTANDA